MKKHFLFFILLSGFLLNAFAQEKNMNLISFDRIVSLKGKPMNFKGRTATNDNPETKLFFRHGKIVLKNKNEELKVFDVKSRKLVFKLGTWSLREYVDFYSPRLFAPIEDSLLCYIEDGGIIYEVNHRGVVRKTGLRSYSYDFEFGGNLERIISDFVKMEGDSILFAGYSKRYGKNLFLTCNEGNKVETEELDFPLNLDTKATDSFVPYHGSFSVRPDRKRGVYAYYSYPVVRMLDLERGGMKTVWQEGKGFDFNTLKKADCARYNTNYCLGCYAGEKYIYVLQAAGSLYDQLDKGNPVYVEQYDWEGNPIQKMKLDKAGHAFCVDEEHGRIYLAERFNAKTSQIFEYEYPL